LVAVATLALLPRLGLAARGPIPKILARPIAELAVGETSFAALAARSTISAIEFRTVAAVELRAISTRSEIPLLATFTIKPRRARSVTKLAIRETPPSTALAARCAIATLEFRAITAFELRTVPAGLEVPLLASPAVVPVKPRTTRTVAIVA